jgi:hypothetical protein
VIIIAIEGLYQAKDPSGVFGEGAIAFGGGAVLTSSSKELLEKVDPEQMVG